MACLKNKILIKTREVTSDRAAIISVVPFGDLRHVVLGVCWYAYSYQSLDNWTWQVLSYWSNMVVSQFAGIYNTIFQVRIILNLVRNVIFQRRACSSSLSPSYHLCLPLGVTNICLSYTPVKPHTDINN